MRMELPINPPNAIPIELKLDDDDPGLSVINCHAELELAATFRFVATVQHPDAALAPLDFVGRALTVHLSSEPRAPRIRGVIRSFRHLAIEPTALSRYELTIVPELEVLSLRTDCRIFKDLTVADIARTVTSRYVAQSLPLVVTDEPSLPKHEYRVQYRETDLALLFRLFAEDGLTSYFDVYSETELVLMTDTRTAAPSPTIELPFAGASGMSGASPHVHSILASSEISATRQTLRDHWIDKPDFNAETSVPAGSDLPFERFVFEPGAGADQAEINRHADELFWAELANSQAVTLASTVFVAPGSRLRVTGADRKEVDDELLVVAVSSSWSAGHADRSPTAAHTIRCIPLATRYVPRRPPRPRIDGIQKALVVGDEEIDIDELGRALCVFPWDREQTVARRVLVSQGWAGPGYGLHAHPRVGNRVLIAYLDGDPNEPIIVGRINDAAVPPPVPVPENKTVSLWRTQSSPGGNGYNELYMDDKAGDELLRLRAQLDYEGVVLRDSTSKVGRDLVVQVQGSTTTSTVESTMHSAGVQSTFLVPEFLVAADNTLSLLSNHMVVDAGFIDQDAHYVLNVTAPQEYHKNSGCWQMSGGRFDVFAESIHLQAGGSSIDITPGGIAIKSAGPVIVNGDVIKLNC